MDSLHHADRSGDHLGRLRHDRCSRTPLDLLARQGAARRLAPARHSRRRRAVGKARVVAARHHRERSPAAADAQRVLRLSPGGDHRHPARARHPPGAVGLLSLLPALSRLQPRDVVGRRVGRGRPERRAGGDTRRGVRDALLGETSLALSARHGGSDIEGLLRHRVNLARCPRGGARCGDPPAMGACRRTPCPR